MPSAAHHLISRNSDDDPPPPPLKRQEPPPKQNPARNTTKAAAPPKPPKMTATTSSISSTTKPVVRQLPPAPVPSSSTVPYCDCGLPALETSIILARGPPCKQWGCGNLGKCEFFQVDKNPVPIPLIPQKRPSPEYVCPRFTSFHGWDLISVHRILGPRKLRTGYVIVTTSPDSRRLVPEGSSGAVLTRNAPSWNGLYTLRHNPQLTQWNPQATPAPLDGPAKPTSVSRCVISEQVPRQCRTYNHFSATKRDTGHQVGVFCPYLPNFFLTVAFQNVRTLPVRVNRSAQRAPHREVKQALATDVAGKATGPMVGWIPRAFLQWSLI